MGAAYAEDGDVSQTRSHERTRTELNLQIPNSEFGQAQNREENHHVVMNKDQNKYQYQYKNMNNHQYAEPSKEKSIVKNSWLDNSGASSMSSMNSSNRYMRNSGAGSMSRQSASSRSGGGGRR